MIIVRDADDLKTIFNSEECFDKINLMYKQMNDYGLFVLNGDTYKHHRKTVNPVFNPVNLRSYLPILNSKMGEFIKRFDSHLQPLKEIDISHYTTDFTLETIFSTMFSNNEINEDDRRRFIKAVDTYENLKKSFLIF